MDRLVLDASVALSWLFRDEESPQTYAVQAMTDDHRIVVPPHWFAEVANGVRQGERGGRCEPVEVVRFLALLDELDFAVDTLKPFAQFSMILPLAREYDLTVYDAIYLHCAISNQLPLATFDTQLARAARKAGILVVDGTP